MTVPIGRNASWQKCLLYDILGRVGIPAEKTCEIVELRNDMLLESGKDSILAREPALDQQAQLIQC
jgi:hypothetical protein